MVSGTKTLSSSSKKKKKHRDDSPPSSSSSFASSSSSSDSEASSDLDTRSKRRHRHHRSHRSSSSKGSSRREKKKERSERRGGEKDRKRRRERSDRHKEKRLKEDKQVRHRRKRKSVEENDSGEESEGNNPKAVVGYLLEKFPDVAGDLKQLLEMIDRGQAVDVGGISDRLFVKQLKKLFLSLDLEESENAIFLLPQDVSPTMEVIGSVIISHLRSREHQPEQPIEADIDGTQVTGVPLEDSSVKDEFVAPKKRVMGPEMPSAELLAAAAKLTEAEANLREAEVEMDDGLFIGPAPPAVVAEAASANEAERFEEVTRIMGTDIDSPYDVLGVNHNMSADNIKKRYWKLSLMVHPDKCSHPQAHQAFVTLNKAFKALQDPNTRKAMDEKIRLKEEQEAFKAELQEMRKAAQWRRLQGISMEGDDELLAEETKGPPKREEWMTTLPPERKAGVSMQSTTAFSRTAKEGRGDTSAWTDAPADKAQKAKMSYLEAYNEAAALAANEEIKRPSLDAELVDQYNRTKRSKSMVEKHQEEKIRRSKKKSKEEKKKEEWVGQHPWKPWDREKDLTGGRQKVNLDSESMGQGLTSRFSSGNIQRNFL